MELMPDDDLPVRSWLAIYKPSGLAGIFRSKPTQERYGSRVKSVELEHGAAEMNDYIVTADIEQSQMSASAAISTLFGYYRGTKWALGTVAAYSTVVLEESSHPGVLDAIISLMDQVPECMMMFDQSQTPWRLNIVPRPANVTAEGRLSRNIESLEITYDVSNLCNRVYMDGVTPYVEDTASQAEYGIIEKRLSETGYTPAQSLVIASAYLDAHKRPRVSVSISAVDLTDLTGETLDQIDLGIRYRLAIPDDHIVIEELITSIRYDDLLDDPYNPQIMLAERPDDLIAFLKRQGRSGAGALKEQLDDLEQQYQHWSEENNVYKTSVYKIMGVTLDQDGNVVYQVDPQTGEYIVDEAGNKVPVYDPQSTGSISGKVTQTAQNLTSLYEVTGVASLPSGETSLYSYTSKVKQTADNVSSEVSAARGGQASLSSRISQLADQISAKVTQADVNSTLQGYLTISAYNASIGVLKDQNGNITGASVAAFINSQTGQGIVKISADKVDIDGTTVIHYLEGGALDVYSLTANEVYAGDLIFDDGSSQTETAFYTTTIGNITNPKQIQFLGVNGSITQASTIDYTDFPHAHAISANANGVVTLGTVVAVGDSTANFNIADTAFYRNHVGIREMALSYQTDDEDDLDYETIGSANLTGIYGIVRAEDKTNTVSNHGIYHYFQVNAEGVWNKGWDAARAMLAPPDALATNTGESRNFSVAIPAADRSTETPATYNFTLVKGTPSANGGYATVSYNGNAVARIDISDWWTAAYAAGGGASGTQYELGQQSVTVKTITPGNVTFSYSNKTLGVQVSARAESSDTHFDADLQEDVPNYINIKTDTLSLPLTVIPVNAHDEDSSASDAWVRFNFCRWENVGGQTVYTKLDRVFAFGIEIPATDPTNAQNNNPYYTLSTHQYTVWAVGKANNVVYAKTSRTFTPNAAIRDGMQQVVWANPSWNGNVLTVKTSGRKNAAGGTDELTKTVTLSGTWHYGIRGQTEPSYAMENAYFSVNSQIDDGTAYERFTTRLTLPVPTFTFVSNSASGDYRKYYYNVTANVIEGSSQRAILARGITGSPLVLDTSAALNAVSITGPTWVEGTKPTGYTYPANTTAQFVTDAPTPPAATTIPLFLTTESTWTNHKKNVYLRPNGASASNTPVAQLIMDAEDEFIAGRNSVNVSGPVWSNTGDANNTNTATFSPSAGTGTTADVALTVTNAITAMNWNSTTHRYAIGARASVKDSGLNERLMVVGSDSLIPTDAIEYGKSQVSVSASFETATVPSGASPTVLSSGGKYRLLVTKDGATVRDAYYSVPAQTAQRTATSVTGTGTGGMIPLTSTDIGTPTKTVTVAYDSGSSTQLSVTINAAPVYTAGRNSVTVTKIERVSSCSYNQTQQTARQTIRLTLSNGSTQTFEGIFDDMYRAGLNGNSVSSTQVEYMATFNRTDEYDQPDIQEDLYLDLADIYQRGLDDRPSTPTANTRYIYQSKGQAVQIQSFWNNTGHLVGNMLPNTPVTFRRDMQNGWIEIAWDQYNYGESPDGYGYYLGYVQSGNLKTAATSPTQYPGKTGWLENQGGGDQPSGDDNYPYTGTVSSSNGGSVNMRKSNSTSSTVVTQVPNGATILCQYPANASYTNAWMPVKYNGYEGFMQSKFIVGTKAYNDEHSTPTIASVTISGIAHQAQYYNGRFSITLAPKYPNSNGQYPLSATSHVPTSGYSNYGKNADGTADISTYFERVYSSYYATNNTQSDMGPSDTECQHRMVVNVRMTDGTSYSRLIVFKSRYR